VRKGQRISEPTDGVDRSVDTEGSYRGRADSMPVVHFAGKSVACLRGANLRLVLLRARLPLYNSVDRAIHCRGLGTCGTCAVRVDGQVSDPTAVERLRLGLLPHTRKSDLRLACQCKVLGDLKVTKYDGLLGQGSEPVSEP